MEQYVKYLRKSRFDRDYAELSVEETLKRHEAILDRLANQRGYHIAKTYYEVVSGESIAARPEIQKLLEEVGQGAYAGVLVVDVERLARGNGADQAYISQVFQFSGTKIITPLKVYDPGNEFDEEYFEFGLFMSRREYKTINRRLTRGRDSSAAEGKYISSIAPYGYRRVKLPQEKGFTLEPHPEEAPVVREIYSMFLNRAGARTIANELNRRQIPTRHGEPWSCSTVSGILSNPVYMGKIRRGWRKQTKRMENGQVVKGYIQHRNLEDYQLFDGLHPPLVTGEQFTLAQELRKERGPSARVKREFALQNAFAGLLYCGVCGKRVGRSPQGAARGGRARLRCVNMRVCHNGTADYELVEGEIMAALGVWLEGYRVKIDATGFAEDIQARRKLLERCGQELEKLDRQLENAYNLVEQGLYTPELFRERREKLNAAIEEAEGRRRELSNALERLEAADASQSELIPRTEKLLESYADMTNRERNELLKEILKRIEYRKGSDGRIEIDLYPRLPQL